MATSVKMREPHKRKLDRLRDDLSRLEGRTLTVQEVLEALVDIGAKDRDRVLAQLSGVEYPMPPSRFKASLAAVGDFGETSAEDIDMTLYGGRRRRRS